MKKGSKGQKEGHRKGMKPQEDKSLIHASKETHKARQIRKHKYNDAGLQGPVGIKDVMGTVE